jgi:hypothetical protein
VQAGAGRAGRHLSCIKQSCRVWAFGADDIRPVYRMPGAERKRGERPAGALRINRLMSEAICTHPASTCREAIK